MGGWSLGATNNSLHFLQEDYSRILLCRTLAPPFKIWRVLRYPAYLCLRLTVPVVDEEDQQMKGWNQKLHVLQCLLAPVFTVFATNTALVTVKGSISKLIGLQ